MHENGDGALDHHGELLPELSNSAKKMNYQKLLQAPLPSYEGNNPGSPFWTNFAYFCLRSTFTNIFRTFEVTGNEKIPRDRGTLCAAWHTNGLLDPISIFLTHPSKFVIGGRHDLVTRPIFGFWARKFALQPVVRKAELLRGGCTEEEATHLNGRSLLNLATGISHGFACALFPEGTSHSKSHLIRLRTGPMRTVLAAAAHAKATGKKMPAIIPIGLHYRVRHLYRTDAWVEYEEPIVLSEEELPEELVHAISEGDWVEPPSESVINLRNKLNEKLKRLTPDKETFEDYRADHIIAHIKARNQGKKIPTWREEVLAAREVKNNPPSNETLDTAKRVGELLYDTRLDGRAINKDASGLELFREGSALNPIISLAKLLLFLTFLPITLYCLSIQIILGRRLGDTTDEGIDARTSYQFLAALLGSVLIWPAMATFSIIMMAIYQTEIQTTFGINWLEIIGTAMWQQAISVVLFWIAINIAFLISGNTFSYGADAINDIKQFFSRRIITPKIVKDLAELKQALK